MLPKSSSNWYAPVLPVTAFTFKSYPVGVVVIVGVVFPSIDLTPVTDTGLSSGLSSLKIVLGIDNVVSNGTLKFNLFWSSVVVFAVGK